MAHFMVINNRMEIRAMGRSRVTITGAFHLKKLSFGWLNLEETNYSGTITTSPRKNAYFSNEASFNFNTDKLYGVMVADKFYDFDSREYHMTLIEEKTGNIYDKNSLIH